MMPQIYKAIEDAVAKGVPPQYISYGLIQAGWPPALVNDAVQAWLASHGRYAVKTEFKTWLKKYRKAALPSVIIVTTLNVIVAGVMLLKPWPTKIMVDSAFGNIPAWGPLEPYSQTATLILITSLMTIAIFLLGAVFGMFKDYMVLKLSFHINRNIKEESFRHILHLPLYHQERLAKGDYVYRQNVVTNSLAELVLGTTASISQSVIMIVGILGIMIVINPKLTMFSVIVIPFLFLFIKIIGPKLGKYAQALSENASKTSSLITESVDNAETVQSFTLEEEQIIKADQLWKRNYDLSRKGQFLGGLFSNTSSLIVILGTSGVMYFGGVAALNKEITLGQLIIFMTYMGFLLQPVQSLASQLAARGQKLVDVNRIYQVLTDHEGIENLRRENHFPISQGQIVFQNVSYTYGGTPVLNNINLTIQPGERVGIIGPSGSGKSTLLKLMPLFIEPTGGRILVDNIDIQSVSLKEVRQNIAWIGQAPQLFSDTIFENLLHGDINRHVSMEEIKQATDVAYVGDVIQKLPLGLNSPAGEGGGSLSGGQKQRIAIARGLLKKAPILCMDEPTAALDAKSENFIKDHIGPMLENRTVMLVTHRKALLDLMTTVYVVENGQLRNVNELGGLETYLQKIAGIEGEQAVKAAPREAPQAQLELQQREAERLRQIQEEARKEQSKQTEQLVGAVMDEDGTLTIKH